MLWIVHVHLDNFIMELMLFLYGSILIQRYPNSVFSQSFMLSYQILDLLKG